MILYLSKSLTRERFIEAVSVEPGSHMESVFNRVYDSINSELFPLRDDFNEYYSDEYQSFEEFLYKKENLTAENTDEVIKKLAENLHLEVYKKPSDSYGDYSMENFIFSDGMYPKIEKILEKNYEV